MISVLLTGYKLHNQWSERFLSTITMMRLRRGGERVKVLIVPGPEDMDKVACQVLAVQAASWCYRSPISLGVSISTSFAHLPAARLAIGSRQAAWCGTPEPEQSGVVSCLSGECVMWPSPYSHDASPASVKAGV